MNPCDMEEYFETLRLEARIPHVSIRIDVEEKRDIIFGDLDQVYRLGSLSKVYGAYIVYRLEQEGKINGDDVIHPHLPLKDTEMTLTHLLTHQTKYDEHFLTQFIDLGLPLSRALTMLSLQEPNEIRTFAYQNIFYLCLPQILESMTGQTVEHWFQHYIVGPLELKSTSLDLPIQHQPRGYHKDLSGIVTLTEFTSRMQGFAGGVCSTVDEVSLFLSLIRSEESFCTVDQSPFYRNGMWTADQNHVSRIHTGSVHGFSSAFMMVLNQPRFQGVVLCDLTDAHLPQYVLQKVLQQGLGAPRLSLNAPLQGIMPVRSPLRRAVTFHHEVVGRVTLCSSVLLLHDLNMILDVIWLHNETQERKALLYWEDSWGVYYEPETFVWDSNPDQLRFEHSSMLYPEPLVFKRTDVLRCVSKNPKQKVLPSQTQ